MTREIAQKDWPAFCRVMTEKYQGASVNLQLINNRVEKIGQDSQLRKIVLDEQSDACNNRLTIETAGLQHEIIEPIRLILRKPTGQENAEHFHTLEILAENGTTVLTLHPGIAAQDLNHL